MAYSYNTTTAKVTVTSTSTARALHDDIQTTFAGASYMQYLIPTSGKIKDGLYQFENGWTFLDSTSVGYMTTGAWKDASGNNLWANIKTVSGDTFTGIQTYYNQTGTPTNFAATGLVNMILPVRTSGTDIASKAVSVYSRPYGYTYSSFTASATSDGLIDSFPLSVAVDPQITIAQATVDAYSDLTITWATVYRSAFDGASTTKYTLNGAHSNSVTTFTVNESIDASVPSTGSFQVESEVITYTGKTLHTFTGCTRGQYRTTAATHADTAALSTNMAQYSTVIKTTSSSRRLHEIYNWVQSRLTKSTDIDSLSGGHIGKLTSPLVSYTGTMVTVAGVWVEGFSSLDNNSITYKDITSTTHTAPLTVPVIVNIDATVVGAQIYVVTLNSAGLNDSTYTPSNILTTLINVTSASTAASTSIVYTSDLPCKVVVRYPGYQQFSLYTTITSSGLNVTAQNPADSTY
jgi:hypothetical protein